MVRLYDTLVQSILLYNAETWTLRDDNNTKLQVYELSVQRKIAGVTWRDKWHNRMIDILLSSRTIMNELKDNNEWVENQTMLSTFCSYKTFNILWICCLNGRYKISEYREILDVYPNEWKKTKRAPKEKMVDNIEEHCCQRQIFLQETVREFPHKCCQRHRPVCITETSSQVSQVKSTICNCNVTCVLRKICQGLLLF